MLSAPKRVVVIGGGRIGAVHARNLSSHGARVTVVEPDPARRDALTSQASLTVVASLAGVGDVDGFVIATPTADHATTLERVVSGGIPVLVEKPVTADSDLTRRLGGLADQAGTPLRVGFQRRFAKENVALQRALRERRGDIDVAVFTSLDGNPPPEDYEVASGSLAFDLQIHDADLMFWLLGGQAVRVECTTKGAAALGGGTDLLVTTVELSSGPVCVLTAKRLNPGGCLVTARLTGSHDDFDTADWQDPGPHRDFLERYGAAYVAEAEDFLRLLHGEDDSLATWTDGARAEDLCASIDALQTESTKEMADVA